MSTFEDLGVQPFLTKSLQSISISRPTPVQAACIPQILAGKDCIGSAQTGSGKTIAFAIPILQELAKDPYGLFALILTPTRELAFQIHEQFRVLGTALSLSSLCITGGQDMMHQSLALARRPHILIATPGRLVDLINSNKGEWSLSKMRFLVLDEADRLLTETFASDLGVILGELGEKRQTLLFTATVTEPVMKLKEKESKLGKGKPFVHLSGESIKVPAGLSQKYIFIPSQVRELYLVYLLTNLATLTNTTPLITTSMEPSTSHSHARHSNKSKSKSHSKSSSSSEDPIPLLPQTILFVPHCRTASLFSSLLSLLPTPIPNAPLHSHLSQSSRLASLASFRSRQVPLLIATDVASRGLDIPDVQVVINWEVPRVVEDYIHRVGRTARAGRSGISLTVVTEMDVDLVKVLEERVGEKLKELEIDEDEVNEGVGKVALAKRMANMQLHADKFGERQDNHRKKQGLLTKAEVGRKEVEEREKRKRIELKKKALGGGAVANKKKKSSKELKSL